MRTVYLGTSDFAAGVLERLAAGPHRPSLVVTRPDRPRGRGRRLQSPPVAERARRLGLELIQPEQLHAPEPLGRIAASRPDVLCVCAYGILLREPLLSGTEILNVHPSLLPRWRGAAPIERAIMAGDSRTGVSIMRLTAGLDSGPVCLQEEEEIRVDDDFGTLSARLERLSGELLVRALDDRPRFSEQPEAGVTYAERIEARDRTLDPAQPPEVVDRTVRALRPHVGARLALPAPAGFLGVAVARLAGMQTAAPAGGRVRVAVGPPARLLLDCRGAALELTEVQPPGGRPMAAADWLRGRPEVGFRLDPLAPGRTVAELVQAAVAEWDPAAEWLPAVEALARRGDAEVLDAVRTLAADARPAARAAAATVLGQLGIPVPAFPVESAAVLENMAVREREPEVLVAVACGLGHLGGPAVSLDTLLGLHRHPQRAVRESVAFALLGRPEPAAARALLTLSADPEPGVRAWAASPVPRDEPG